MCETCYVVDYMSPEPTEAARIAAIAVEAITSYALGGSIGYLVIEDWNVQDDFFDYCLSEENLSYGRANGADDEEITLATTALTALKALPEDQRAAALAVAAGYVT